MLKNILKQPGVKKLDRNNQRNINGGNASDCQTGWCYDPDVWFVDGISCCGTCADGTKPNDCPSF